MAVVVDMIGRYGRRFHGDVSVTLQSKLCKSGIRATLKNPEIQQTPVGVRLVSGENRVDIDYRNIDEINSMNNDYCCFEYKDTGVVMAVAFMAS